jgi:hypothetical protein
MHRFWQILLITSTFGFSWLGMMVFHESGHVLHAWAGGGEVARVVLHPLAFSRTDYAANPHPLLAAWGGAVWGTVLPVVLWLAVRLAANRYDYLARFFAGFCLVTNGAYLGAGSFFAGGGDDAGLILRHGGQPWQLWLFGLAAMAAGLVLWNGLGPKFGLGSARGRVDVKAAVGMAMGLVVLSGVEIAFSRMW